MKQGSIFFSMAILAVLFGACTANEDLYDPAKAEALVKEQYRDNFVKSFGEVTPDYSWDATSAYPRYGAVTRAEVNYEPTTGDYYEVPSETLEWLQSQLPERENNRQKGSPFLMTVPNNKFTLIPIYQGEGALDWELHMVVGGEDVTLWKKHDGIQVDRDGEWEELGSQGLFDGGKHTEKDKKVQGLRYTLDLTGATGQPMFFYLKITSLSFSYNQKGTRLSSLDHMMLALNCPCPGQEFDGKEVMVVGCEDNKGKDGIIFKGESDWDMNDLVFMIVGEPKVPQKIDIQESMIVERIAKRYMIEDLGSTCDFDFNDIVVDVIQEQTKKIVLEDGVIDESQCEYVGSATQKAIIRHLGGVLPFRLTIGTTELDEMEGQLGVNPDSEFPISGWNPERNDITVQVANGKNEEPYTVKFPGEGEIPMIIAVDPEVAWMEEQKSITQEWFEGIQKK